MHPFLDSAFIRIVQMLPLARRYEPTYETAYWRQKALVISLLPSDCQESLPRQKQTFRHYLADVYCGDKTSAECLIELGLIDSNAWRRTEDVAVIHRVNELEKWVRGALDRGYIIG